MIGTALLIYLFVTLAWQPIYIRDLPFSEAVHATPLTAMIHIFMLVCIGVAGLLLWVAF